LRDDSATATVQEFDGGGITLDQPAHVFRQRYPFADLTFERTEDAFPG
jgi:hypothetical protein